MSNSYADVNTRFLHSHERLISSKADELPLVIEPKQETSMYFLKNFLSSHSREILEEISTYGAILLRGFDVSSETDFESALLSIHGLEGISEAFMSEEGRVPVGDLNYVLHTNAVYKTGGTLYLGGFHNENYYSADVPSFISFCCFTPSTKGGETGLIHMEKVYQCLSDDIKQQLEKRTFFVSKWLLSEVAARYHLTPDAVEDVCRQFGLPLVGKGKKRFVVMYKPSVYIHPVTQKKALQINFFQLRALNRALRRCFINDYQGNSWFWHRLVWRLPESVFKALEVIYVMFASFFYSPKDSLKILLSKIKTYLAFNKKTAASFNALTVESCFEKDDIQELAKHMRDYYSSCLWQKGDILIVDNKQVVHAGMPGKGPRVIRAMICDPLEMNYSYSEPGTLSCKTRTTEGIGARMMSQQEMDFLNNTI